MVRNLTELNQWKMVNLKGTYQTHPLPTNNFIQNQICEKLSAKSSDAKLSKYHSHEKSDKWHNDIKFSSILFDLNITRNHNSCLKWKLSVEYSNAFAWNFQSFLYLVSSTLPPSIRTYDSDHVIFKQVPFTTFKPM